MLIGYARVSKADGSQLLDLQRDALIDAGVAAQRIYEDRASGRKDHRPGLNAGLKASSGEGSEDLVDRANHAYSRELNFSLSDSDGNLLERIDEATTRLDDGSFGVCVHCHSELGPARLEAVPWASYCINCQELEEKGRLPREE